MTRAPRRILLTGASGFVGRHLRAALAAAYPEAAVLTPMMDVRDGAAVAAAVAEAAPDACVHLAAISAVGAAGRDEDQAWQVNLHGSLHLARAILRHAADCQVLFVSSADAYGPAAGRLAAIDEDTPLAPVNVYAATKAAADLALGSMVSQGLRVVRVRPFNHTGPGQSADFVIPAFARQVARIAAGLQPPVLEVGNLDAARDFMDVRDVCAAYVACIDRRDVLPPGTILNLCSGEAHRIGDILDDLLKLAGVAAEIRQDPSRMRAVDARRNFGDAARARALLGWAPATPWGQTLRDVLEDWRSRAGIAPGEA
ncbi:MAG: GDP-mannose 4,6-dehydratase [Rhodospirillales bacterium]|nr:GDP-mannose 4,6-dehydratase [Rhodospirillales bacterium]